MLILLYQKRSIDNLRCMHPSWKWQCGLRPDPWPRRLRPPCQNSWAVALLQGQRFLHRWPELFPSAWAKEGPACRYRNWCNRVARGTREHCKLFHHLLQFNFKNVYLGSCSEVNGGQLIKCFKIVTIESKCIHNNSRHRVIINDRSSFTRLITDTLYLPNWRGR